MRSRPLFRCNSARSLVASISSFVNVAMSAEPLNHGLLTANETDCGLSYTVRSRVLISTLTRIGGDAGSSAMVLK
jgi:hypothetical protein